jgi:hypothetical protein
MRTLLGTLQGLLGFFDLWALPGDRWVGWRKGGMGERSVVSEEKRENKRKKATGE